MNDYVQLVWVDPEVPRKKLSVVFTEVNPCSFNVVATLETDNEIKQLKLNEVKVMALYSRLVSARRCIETYGIKHEY